MFGPAPPVRVLDFSEIPFNIPGLDWLAALEELKCSFIQVRPWGWGPLRAPRCPRMHACSGCFLAWVGRALGSGLCYSALLAAAAGPISEWSLVQAAPTSKVSHCPPPCLCPQLGSLVIDGAIPRQLTRLVLRLHGDSDDDDDEDWNEGWEEEVLERVALLPALRVLVIDAGAAGWESPGDPASLVRELCNTRPGLQVHIDDDSVDLTKPLMTGHFLVLP